MTRTQKIPSTTALTALTALTPLTALIALAACASNPSEGAHRDWPGAPQVGDPADPHGAAGSPSDPTGSSDPHQFGNSSGPSATQPTDPVGEQEACVQQMAEADLSIRPVDIIFMIDTSSSMNQEISGVQNNINDNFANLIAASGIDYQVIVLADDDVCISGPLNPGGCGASNPPVFTHADVKIDSEDTWCQLLDYYDVWGPSLRPEALKIFVEVSDDSPRCRNEARTLDFSNDEAGAIAFDRELMALDPEQFGTEDARNYVWHSLIAVKQNTPATDPYLPTDPVVDAECPTANESGVGYQSLSRMTGGLRFPVCEGHNFDAVFEVIATAVVEGSVVQCEFPIPASPEGDDREIDLDTVEVAYTPSDGAAPEKLRETPNPSDCDASSFLIDGNDIRLCPTACDRVQGDLSASLQVHFGCKLPPPG